MPVVPATREAEVGGWFELGRWRLRELRSHHCTPAWVTEPGLCLKKKERTGQDSKGKEKRKEKKRKKTRLANAVKCKTDDPANEETQFSGFSQSLHGKPISRRSI